MCLSAGHLDGYEKRLKQRENNRTSVLGELDFPDKKTSSLDLKKF